MTPSPFCSLVACRADSSVALMALFIAWLPWSARLRRPAIATPPKWIPALVVRPTLNAGRTDAVCVSCPNRLTTAAGASAHVRPTPIAPTDAHAHARGRRAHRGAPYASKRLVPIPPRAPMACAASTPILADGAATPIGWRVSVLNRNAVAMMIVPPKSQPIAATSQSAAPLTGIGRAVSTASSGAPSESTAACSVM